MKQSVSQQELENEIEKLRQELEEARETIEAIKNGEVDALIVNGKNGNELFTLKSADHTYRVFIEKMSEGAVTLNSEGEIVYCNSSFAEMVGEEPSNLVIESFVNYVVPDDKSRFDALLKLGWEQDVRSEIELIQKESVVPVQVSLTTLNMDEGVALSVIVTDLTSQKETLKQLRIKNDQLAALNLALELSNHDLQQFASVASHDLQEPLRKIQIFSHLLTEKFSDELSATSQQYLDKIMRSASRMKVLIIDILNYSRLSSKDNQYEKTDLRKVINELLLDLELTIKEKKAIITIGKMPEVEVNPGQMRQVFQNLISNSLKFSREGIVTQIDIFCNEKVDGNTLEKTNSDLWCHLHVRDNGIGFDQKYSSSIFNLFEKLHSKDDFEGTGIGLAITKKIIEKHNGFIGVTSMIGVGTEFILSLPIYQRNS